MLKEKKDYETGNNDLPYSFTDKATKEKIKRHLSDINDVISENDIKNAKIPWIDEPAYNNEPVLKAGGSEGNPSSPWDIVD